MQQTLNRIDTAPPLRRPAFAVGLLVSVLLHVLLLWFLRLPGAPAIPADTRPWSQPLTVRLVAPPPPPPVIVEQATPATPAPAKRERTRPEGSQAITVAPREAAPAQAVPAPPVLPEQGPQQGEPRVDLDAARAAARGMASDLDPPATNWAAEKLNKGKEWRETRDEKLGKAVARSARPECRDTGAGLLSPLVWLMDKKDSGCKF